MKRQFQEDPPFDPKDETFIVECRLKSGAFTSRIEIALIHSKTEEKKFIADWLEMMAYGLKKGITEMAYIIDRDKP